MTTYFKFEKKDGNIFSVEKSISTIKIKDSWKFQLDNEEYYISSYDFLPNSLICNLKPIIGSRYEK